MDKQLFDHLISLIRDQSTKLDELASWIGDEGPDLVDLRRRAAEVLVLVDGSN